MSTLASMLIALGLTAQEYNEGLDQAEGRADQASRNMSASLEKSGKAMDALGAKMSLAVTAPIVAGMALAVGAASDLEESVSKVGQVFGDQADAVEAFADSAAKNLGMTEQAALDAMGTFGALFSSVGLATEPTRQMSESLVTLAADLASFYNLDPGDALDKLRAGIIGEAEPLRTMGVLLDAASTSARAMELGLADANGQLSQGALMQARYALIMEQTTKAQGDFARTSEGLANSTRILKAQFGDLGAELGGVLLPFAQQLVGALSGALGWVSRLSPEMQTLVVQLAGLAASLGPVLVGLGKFTQLIAAIKAGGLAAAFGGIGVAALGLVAVLAAVAAGALIIKNRFDEINRQGAEAVGGTWTKFFDDLAKSGADAAEIAQQYTDAQERVTRALENANPVARLFIQNQDALAKSSTEAAEAILNASTDYKDYESAMLAAGLEAKILTEYHYDLERGVGGASAAFDDMGESIETAKAEMMEIDQIMGIVESSLSAAGFSGSVLAGKMSELSVAVGQTTQAQAALESSVRLVSDAFAQGVISEAQFTQYLKQAADGTLELSNAEQVYLSKETAYRESLQRAAEAAQGLAIKQMELAQSLRDATDAQIAQAAINELKAAFDNGQISFEQFAGAVTSVQEQFGLVDETSVMAAEGILGLVEALGQGRVPAEEFGGVMSEMLAQIEGGELQLDKLLEPFQKMESTIEPGRKAVEGMITEFDNLSGKAEDMSGDVIGEFDLMTAGVLETETGVTESFAQMGESVGEFGSHVNISLSALETFERVASRLNGKELKLKAATEGFEAAVEWVQSLASAIDSLPSKVETEITVTATDGGGQKRPEPTAPTAVVSGLSDLRGDQGGAAGAASGVNYTDNRQFTINDPLTGQMLLRLQEKADRDLADRLM